MPQPAADRNLLFGILAMEMDFITREQLVNAMQAWVFDKKKSLGEILVAQKSLQEDGRSMIEMFVQQHLAKHNHDTEKSLAAVSSGDDVRTELARIVDVDVQASLSHVPSPTASATAADPYATIAPAAGGDVDDAPLPGVAAAGGMRFRIVRPHARGGLGEVFVAHDQELHREVALKEILERAADSHEHRTRFMLEAEITGGLEHPGIVPVYGYGAYADGRPYYAMRFIRGDSLKEAVDRFHKADKAGMTPGQQTLEIRGLLRRFVDVCDAIFYAHSRGVLHRDIKPGNIMLGKFGETLVVDWGLAKPLGAPVEETPATELGERSLMPKSMNSTTETMHGAAVGTPQYMSPEQAAGRLEVLGPASDVYSLGGTLFFILTGQSPIADTDVSTVLARVKSGEIRKVREVAAEVPRALEAIVLKAMALAPADRYGTARALADDIEHWLADEPVSAYKEPWTKTARRWIGRHATLVTSVGSAVVVALILLIVSTILLTAANERERLAKKKAEENYQLARAAVHKYLDTVSEEDLLNEPGMENLRRNLLDAAKDFYTKFVADRADDPELRGEVAKAHYRLGKITADIGTKDDAIRMDETAAKLFEDLPQSMRNDDITAEQAACYRHLGELYRRKNDNKKSAENYDKALKLWEPLAAADPKNERYSAGLARTWMGIGNVHQNASRLEPAVEAYQKSLPLWSALATARPKSTEYARDLAVNQRNLGILLQRLAGKDKEAETALRGAEKNNAKLVDEAPNISRYRNELAAARFSLVGSTSDAAESASLAQQAADAWQALTKEQPAVTENHLRFADALQVLARNASRKQDHPKAEELGQQALAIERKLVEKDKDNPACQAGLAKALATWAMICQFDTRADRSKEAESTYADALQIQMKLTADANAAPHLQRDLAQTLDSLGLFHAQKFREEKAVEAYTKSIAWWDKLVTAHPIDKEYAIGQSRTYFNLGTVTHFAGDLKKADAWYSSAVASFDVKKLKSLDSPSIKNNLCNAYWMRADTRTQLKQYDIAVGDWTRALELAQPKQKPAIQLPRAAALARAGKYTDAIAEVEPLVGTAKAGESLYRFASVYALAAGAAKDKKDLADEYAAKAIELLTKAKDANLFESGANQKRVLTDPDLQALRDRPAFKTLTSEFKVQ